MRKFNRRGFLKFLGKTAVASGLVPKQILNKYPEARDYDSIEFLKPIDDNWGRWVDISKDTRVVNQKFN